MKKTIGIIGGMGSLAAVDLFEKITRMTKASTDHEHIHVLVDSNTAIPDRTEAILHGGADPVPEIVASARRLEAAGAGLLIMSCNTAHYYFDRIQESINTPLLNMLRETAKEVDRRKLRCVGLLATDATINMKLYHNVMEEQGIQVIVPSETGQRLIMTLIYEGIKAGKSFDMQSVFKEMNEMKARGAQGFILGCTELPIAFAGVDAFSLIDPTTVLARAAIVSAGYEPRR